MTLQVHAARGSREGERGRGLGKCSDEIGGGDLSETGSRDLDRFVDSLGLCVCVHTGRNTDFVGVVVLM